MNEVILKESKQKFKPSPLGPIPVDWELMELNKLTKKIGSGITPTGGEKVYKKQGRPFLRSQNIGWGNLLLDDVVFIDEETHNSFKSTEIELNDLFLNITGASIGRSALADARIVSGNVNQHVCIIRTKEDELQPYFLNQFLLSKKGQNLIDSYQAGGNRQGLNFEQIKSFKIPLPPVEEQTIISILLSTWDKTIDKTTQLITQKEQRKKWLMQQLLTGDKRLKGFNGKWSKHLLSDVFDFLKSYSYTRDNLTADSNEGDILYIHYGDIHALFENETLDFEIENRIPFLNNSFNTNQEFEFLKDGDLVMVDASEDYEGVGECVELINIRKRKAIAGLHTIALRDAKGLTTEGFRAHMLSNPIVKNYLRTLATGSSVFGISKTNVGKVELILPPIEEQSAISFVLNSADKEIQLLNNKLKKLKEQKKGLMQVLLTGKKRLSY